MKSLLEVAEGDEQWCGDNSWQLASLHIKQEHFDLTAMGKHLFSVSIHLFNKFVMTFFQGLWGGLRNVFNRGPPDGFRWLDAGSSPPQLPFF